MSDELERRDKDPVKAQVTEDRFYRFWDTWLTTGEVPHLFRCDLAAGALTDLTPKSTVWFDCMDPSGQYDISPDGAEIVTEVQLESSLRGQPTHDMVSIPRYALRIASGNPTALKRVRNTGFVAAVATERRP